MKGAFSLILASLVALANAGASYTNTIKADGLSFAADVNVTVDEGDNRFHFRKTQLVALDILNTAFYYSTAVDVEHSGSSVSGELDMVFAYSIAPLVTNHPPGVVMCYLNAEGSADQNALTSTFTASGSALATAYYAIQEVKPDGEIVKTIKLEDINYTQDSGSSAENPEIQYVTYSGGKAGAEVDLTMVVSSVTGILNVGGAPITPKSAEIILEIEYPTYAAAGNHLRLTVFTATASVISEVSASANTMISGSGPTQVYIHFNGEAVVNGAVKSVTVNGVASSNSASGDNLGTLEAFVSANGELNVDYRKVTIDFPANANTISYDPSMGFDAPKIYAAAGTLSVPAALIFALSALLVFFF